MSHNLDTDGFPARRMPRAVTTATISTKTIAAASKCSLDGYLEYCESMCRLVARTVPGSLGRAADGRAGVGLTGYSKEPRRAGSTPVPVTATASHRLSPRKAETAPPCLQARNSRGARSRNHPEEGDAPRASTTDNHVEAATTVWDSGLAGLGP